MKRIFFMHLMILCAFNNTYPMIAGVTLDGCLDGNIEKNNQRTISWINLCHQIGCDINQPKKEGYVHQQTYIGGTPLKIACQFSNFELVQHILSFPETNPNIYAWYGKTFIIHTLPPLHSVIGNKDKDAMAIKDCLILDPRTDVNLIDQKGNIPLHLACQHGDETAVQQLLLHPGINKEIKNKKGETPLYVAHSLGCKKNINIITLLLDNGCSADTEDNDLNTPLHIIAQHGSAELMSMLIKKGACVRINKHNQTPLHSACYYFKKQDHLEKARMLLSLMDQEQVNIQNSVGETALHIALYSISATTALLLKRGANMHIKNKKNHTPLVCTELSFAPFDNWFINQINNHTLIPELLGFESHNEMVQMLGATDKEGNTQFHHYAITHDLPDDHLEALAKLGLPIWVRNIHGKTPLDIAQDEYARLLSAFQQTKDMKEFFVNQEKNLHLFLRIASPQIKYQSFKEIFTNFHLPTELQQLIMQLFYQLNIETLIARKCKQDKTYEDYYDKTIEEKNRIKQQLIDNPIPFLLWRDAKQEKF